MGTLSLALDVFLTGAALNMFSSDSQKLSLQQSVMTSIIQESQQSCTSVTTSESNNNSLLVRNSVIVGNLYGVTQQQSTDVSCALTSTMDSNVKEMLTAGASAKQTTEQGPLGEILNLFDSGDTQDIDLEQSVSNYLSQITVQTCQSNNLASANNNLVYITGSSILGDVYGISNRSNFSSACSLSNTAKASVDVTLHGTIDADQTKKSAWTSIIKVLIIGSVIIVGLILLIIIIKALIPSKKNEPLPTTPQAPLPTTPQASLPTTPQASLPTTVQPPSSSSSPSQQQEE